MASTLSQWASIPIAHNWAGLELAQTLVTSHHQLNILRFSRIEREQLWFEEYYQYLLSFKKANIRPVVKKPNQDKEELKNNHPVFNLHFLSNITEKLVDKRLETHLSSHRPHDNFQSVYRTGHSTESALLKFYHDIAEALDRKCMTALVLIDPSAACDVIDHKILQTWLEY